MKREKVLAASILLAVSMSGTAFAGEWKQDSIGWWYQNDDGSYPSNTWQWIDGNYDGIAESYFFDANGYCLMNTVTPDGYTVDLNGAWTIDGIVQTQVTADTSVSASQTASAAPIQEGVWYFSVFVFTTIVYPSNGAEETGDASWIGAAIEAQGYTACKVCH